MIAALLGLDTLIVEAGAILLLARRAGQSRPAVAALPVFPVDADAETVIITRLIPPGSRNRSEGDRQRDRYARQFRLSVWHPCAGSTAIQHWAVQARIDAQDWSHLMPQWEDGPESFRASIAAVSA